MSRNVSFALVLLCAGCATHADRLMEVRAAYFAGSVAEAESKLDTFAKKHRKEADAFHLDKATILLTQGKLREAEHLFRQVRDRFDYLDQKDLAEGALAMLTDDEMLSYAGEDYEKVLVRAFLALTNLLGDGQDAGAYALQVAEKQKQIIEKGKEKDGKNPKADYQQVAVGAYIHALLREQTHMNYDDATRSLQLVCNWAPDFRAGREDLERLQHGRHSERGNGVVYVFTLVGRGPYKEERMELPTTAALLVADRIVSATANHSLPPTIAPIMVPRVVLPENFVQTVGVAVDGQQRGQTETVTDVGHMAVAQADAVFPTVLGRAIARRIIKKGAIYGVKEAIGNEANGLPSLALDAAGVVWEATESADTRCWGLLPDKIQVLRLELPAGTHQLALQPLRNAGAPLGAAHSTSVTVEDGRNTYVLAFFPSDALAGQIVCSRAGR